MQPAQGRGEALLLTQAPAEGRRALGCVRRRQRAEVERGAERCEPALVDCDVRPGHAGAVAGREDPGLRGALPLVHGHDRAAQVLVVGEVAAREPKQLDGGEEAVAETERVGLDPFLAAGDRAPLGVGGGVDDLLHPAVTLRCDDDPPVPKRDARSEERRAVGDGVAEQGHVAARRGEEPHDVADAGSGPGLEDGGDVRAVPAQLRRERERERAAAREQDAFGREARAGS